MKAVGAIVLFALAVIIESFTFMSLWEWFIVPLGVKSITMVHAIGMALLIAIFSRNTDDSRKIKAIVSESICGSLLILLIGFTVSIFM